MSKYGWLFLMMFIITLTTIITAEIETANTASDITNSLPSNAGLNIGTVTSFFKTYFNLLTFNVSGIPSIINTLFITLNIIVGFIILESILIPAVEAIIPF